MRRPGAKVVAPVAILLLSLLVVWLIHATREPIEPRAPDTAAPLVRVVSAEPQDFRFRVEAQGTVEPRRESELVPQVSGEVVWVSPDLVDGGFFEAGQPLVRIERADYEAALESARANVARAESEYARARKELDRQQRLADRSVASQSRIDDAENANRVAEATLRERRAQLERAERDLERTELRAPYMGRVRSEQVDEGQFVSRGERIAKLYAVDYAEVRLPLPDRELAYLELTLTDPRRSLEADDPAREGDPVEEGDELEEPAAGPLVDLRAMFAGKEHHWQGRIVRTEGELDPKSRMLQLVVRVEDPYGLRGPVVPGRPPLAVGLFVDASIEGRLVEGVYVLPRSALRLARGEDTPRLLVVDDESRIRIRDAEILRTEHERVIVGRGLEPGERVCVSPLRIVTDDMRVRVAGDSSEGQLAGGSP